MAYLPTQTRPVGAVLVIAANGTATIQPTIGKMLCITSLQASSGIAALVRTDGTVSVSILADLPVYGGAFSLTYGSYLVVTAGASGGTFAYTGFEWS
jgi:hypothetical protein